MILAETTTVTIDALGFSVEIPKGWVLQSDEEVKDNRDRAVALNVDQRVQEAGMPVVAASRYPRDPGEITPTVQVIYRAALSADASPAQTLEALMAPMAEMFNDFAMAGEVQEATLAGRRAAHGQATYRLGFSWEEDKDVLSDMWLVPQGDHMFLIGFSGPASGDNAFESILSSMRFAKPE